MKNNFDILKNPNTEDYEEITQAVKDTDGYCPCMRDKNDDTKCMCKAFRESTENDFCHCGRFYKIKNYETLALIGDISDSDAQEVYIDWCERLAYQNFITLDIVLNPYDYHFGSDAYMQLNKSKIAKADAVLIVAEDNIELKSVIEELTWWADSIGKKILYRSDLLK